VVEPNSPDAVELIHDTLECANMDVLVALEGKSKPCDRQADSTDLFSLDPIIAELWMFLKPADN